MPPTRQRPWPAMSMKTEHQYHSPPCPSIELLCRLFHINNFKHRRGTIKHLRYSKLSHRRPIIRTLLILSLPSRAVRAVITFIWSLGVFQTLRRLIPHKTSRYTVLRVKASQDSETHTPVLNASVGYVHHASKCLWQSMEHKGSAHAVLLSAAGSSLFSSK